MNASLVDSVDSDSPAELESYQTIFSGKYVILKEQGARPAIAIQPELGFSVNREVPVFSEAALIVLLNNTLSDRVFLNYNFGLSWKSDLIVEYLLSASLGILQTEKLGYFIEIYTLSDFKNSPLPSFDLGVTYLLREKLQLDIYLGRNNSHPGNYWYYGTGVGFRIDKKRVLY
jgi:hypothetical protein